MIEILISAKTDIARIALLEDELLTEYSVWPFDRPGDIDDVFSGRITARAPALAGSFVNIGETAGFLPDSAGAAGHTEGEYLTVAVTRYAQGGKGPRLVTLPEAPARKPGLVRHGLGPLGTLAARHPSVPIFADDYGFIAMLSARCRQLGDPPLAERITHKPMTFDPVLEDEIALLTEPSVVLPGGARIHVAPTAALTAIDVDAGAHAAERTVKPQSQLNLNLALLPHITRQIRLRNLSGAILIDFVGMKSAARPKLLPALVEALKSDPLHPKCLGFTRLGFAEISRPRIRPPLHEFVP